MSRPKRHRVCLLSAGIKKIEAIAEGEQRTWQQLVFSKAVRHKHIVWHSIQSLNISKHFKKNQSNNSGSCIFCRRVPPLKKLNYPSAAAPTSCGATEPPLKFATGLHRLFASFLPLLFKPGLVLLFCLDFVFWRFCLDFCFGKGMKARSKEETQKAQVFAFVDAKASKIGETAQKSHLLRTEMFTFFTSRSTSLMSLSQALRRIPERSTENFHQLKNIENDLHPLSLFDLSTMTWRSFSARIHPSAAASEASKCHEKRRAATSGDRPRHIQIQSQCRGEGTVDLRRAENRSNRDLQKRQPTNETP